MIIFKDIISGDEMISDVYDLKEVDGVLYEADCAMITVSKGGDVDIGANASAEEAAEELEDGQESVNNVVFSFRLNPTSFDKKSYLTYLKGYMKAIKKKMQDDGKTEEEVTAFEKGAAAAAKKIVANFKNYDFYIGESMDLEGMVALMNYREDGVTPYMIFWKHGLKEEKV
ncbi:Mss4-like protein [Pyronema domesticum]|uniref:Translationally-controlled tumor protein homolog n=1 Tax=Pyronema omphalodes (strain CBS 100304) TaxID=1076935 RepID=U4L1E3_PYROM|nr:Mss4-like protein [Pyronema domesticum]CCX09236.1 Similar to Translationally-controlled tumor protein homolog; acc. no. Q10344 [Pyronema omphalodes CBS 100304]